MGGIQGGRGRQHFRAEAFFFVWVCFVFLAGQLGDHEGERRCVGLCHCYTLFFVNVLPRGSFLLQRLFFFFFKEMFLSMSKTL